MTYCRSKVMDKRGRTRRDRLVACRPGRSDRVGACVGIILVQGGCWWEARPGPVPAHEATRGPEVHVQQGTDSSLGMELLLRAGSAHDPVGLEGLSCGLIQAQVAQAMDADSERLAVLNGAGLEWQLEVDRELIRLRMSASEDAASELSSLLGDVVMSGEILDPHRHLSSRMPTESAARSRLLDWLYAGHPYGHDPGCSGAWTGRFSSAQLVNFQSDRYLRSTTRLLVEFPEGEAAASKELILALDGLVGRLETLPASIYQDVSPRMIPSPMEGRLVLAESAPGEIWMGWSTPVYPGHADWPALLLATEVLTARTSPLSPVGVRHSSNWLSADGQAPGWLGIPLVLGWTGVDAQGAALEAILPKLEAWTRGPYTLKELEDARSQLTSRLTEGQGQRAAQAELLGWTAAWAELPGALEGLESETIVAALGRHARVDQLRVLVGIEGGSVPEWIPGEGSAEVPVDAAVPPSYDWKMGEPIRIDLQEP